MKKALIGIAVLVVLGVLAFGLEWAGIAWKGYFAPKHAAIDRKVFKQTRSYNEGKEQELLKHFTEYQRADEDGKRAVAAVVRIGFADYDEKLIDSPELRAFVKTCKYGGAL